MDSKMKPFSLRDPVIDVLKGVGCLAMIVAHAGLNFGGYERFKFWGGLAPVLFFSAAGVTASFQALKYKPRGVLLTYLFLLLLGFSFNRITDPGFLREIEFDIIQMTAVGSVTVYLLEYYFRPRPWVYFIMAVLSFGLKFILQRALAGAFLPGAANLLVPPGIFPVFPWLFLFFLGLFAFRVENSVNAVFAAGLGAALFFMQKMGVPLDLENKWDMSPGYFLVAMIAVLSAFFTLRFFSGRGKLLQVKSLLNFLGQNSLLFLYVHFPIILYLKENRIHRSVKLIFQHPWLFWLLILALTLALMLLLLWLAKRETMAQMFDRLPLWIFMTLLVFAAGLFISSERLTYFIEIGLGILTALYYPRLANILKQRMDSADIRID